MSAASMATSVPVPMASPMSAAARAGASLIPSPAIPTVRPSACRRRISAALCSGSTSASTRLHPDLAGDRGGSAGVVTGQHDHVDAQAAQRRDRGSRVVLDRVGDREHPGRLAVDGGQHRRLALPGQLGGGGLQGAGADAGGGQQPGAADQDRVPVHGGLDALAGDRPEPGRLRDVHAPAGGTGHDRGGQRVLAVGLRGGHQCQQLVLVPSPGGPDVGEGGLGPR